MRILLFVGTVDLVLSLIGYLYYRHTLPIGRTPAFGLLYLLLACLPPDGAHGGGAGNGRAQASRKIAFPCSSKIPYLPYNTVLTLMP